MSDLLPITVREMADECERESQMRRMVYPRQVEARKMTAIRAERRIAVMQAAAEYLRKHQDDEP